MSKFKNFETQLVNAVRFAELNETPTKSEIEEVKSKLKMGLTYGQFDLVKRVYNSTLRSIQFQKAKATKA